MFKNSNQLSQITVFLRDCIVTGVIHVRLPIVAASAIVQSQIILGQTTERLWQSYHHAI